MMSVMEYALDVSLSVDVILMLKMKKICLMMML